jgi:polyhydroxyalkanoate synthesis regulator phasin
LKFGSETKKNQENIDKLSTKNNFFLEQESSVLKEKVTSLEGEIRKLQESCK